MAEASSGMRLEISELRATRYRDQMLRVLDCPRDAKTSAKANTVAGAVRDTRFELRPLAAAIC